MSESLGGLRRKIDGAGELGSVVRTMKALAASSIGAFLCCGRYRLQPRHLLIKTFSGDWSCIDDTGVS